MDPLLLVVLKVVGSGAGLALFWYALYRGVLSAKKKTGRAGIGGALMATALTLFGGTALDPAREVATESQRLKRNQDGNGDPDNSDSQP